MQMQIDIFGSVEETPVTKTRRRSTTPRKRATSKKKAAPTALVEDIEGITMRHQNASKSMPDHMLLLCPEYDPTTDELLLDWDENTLLELWDGMLNEHLKQLRQTKPGSATRLEILEWQQSESFKDLCAAIAYRPEDIRDGVLAALQNYDSVAETRSIINMLVKLDSKVVKAVEDAELTRRECNSRRFKDQLADWFLTEFRKCRSNSKKWIKISTLMHSDELRDLASQIGMDMSGVINRIKPKMYFIQNPNDAEFDV
ncbi:conserved hypothetical protein [Vibrio crassostreae]|nr:conserved hypothetical protein [Vibrio chagasii]CAK2856354.1 conserved hypothetical protein [Vibrio crassostreae]